MDRVEWVLSLCVTIAAQFLLGASVYALVAWLVGRDALRGGGKRRRRLLAWTEAARALGRAAPYAAVLLALALAGWSWLVSRPLSEIVGWTNPVVFVTLGTLAPPSGYLMLFAGRQEARGRLGAARRLVRLGGQLLFLAIAAQSMLAWWDLIMRPGFRRAMLIDSPSSGAVLVAGLVSLFGAAFIAVLAGLAGKPRPSAYFAGLFYVAGIGSLLAAVAMA